MLHAMSPSSGEGSGGKRVFRGAKHCSGRPGAGIHAPARTLAARALAPAARRPGWLWRKAACALTCLRNDARVPGSRPGFQIIDIAPAPRWTLYRLYRAVSLSLQTHHRQRGGCGTRRWSHRQARRGWTDQRCSSTSRCSTCRSLGQIRHSEHSGTAQAVERRVQHERDARSTREQLPPPQQLHPARPRRQLARPK